MPPLLGGGLRSSCGSAPYGGRSASPRPPPDGGGAGQKSGGRVLCWRESGHEWLGGPRTAHPGSAIRSCTRSRIAVQVAQQSTRRSSPSLPRARAARHAPVTSASGASTSGVGGGRCSLGRRRRGAGTAGRVLGHEALSVGGRREFRRLALDARAGGLAAGAILARARVVAEAVRAEVEFRAEGAREDHLHRVACAFGLDVLVVTQRVEHAIEVGRVGELEGRLVLGHLGHALALQLDRVGADGDADLRVLLDHDLREVEVVGVVLARVDDQAPAVVDAVAFLAGDVGGLGDHHLEDRVVGERGEFEVGGDPGLQRLGDGDVERLLRVRGDDGEVREVVGDLVPGAMLEVLGRDECDVVAVLVDGVALRSHLDDLEVVKEPGRVENLLQGDLRGLGDHLRHGDERSST